MGHLKKLTTAILIILILVASAGATDYYVDNTGGADGNSGTSTAEAWATINKANNTVTAGDTVYIRAGTYNETIKPGVSGANGNRITYANYNNETVTITGVFYGADLRDRSYITLDGLRILDTTNSWVTIKSGGYTTQNTIRNCYMNTMQSWSGISVRYSTYLTIEDSTFIGTCSCNAACDRDGPADLLYLDGCSHTLLRGNTFKNGNHQSVNFQSHNGNSDWNIIVDNHIENIWHGVLSLYGDINYAVVDNNRLLYAGEEATTNWCGSERDRTEFAREDHRSIQFASSRCIIRRNVFVKNGTMPFLDYEGYTVNNNRVYNNTHYMDYEAVDIIAGTGNIIKNNIVSDGQIFGIKGSAGNSIINNNVYECNLTANGATVQDNTNLAPGFTDAANEDFTLQSTSDMIDAGAWLTTITSATDSGTSFVVNDATYFHDGYGLIDGDEIQLEGDTAPVGVTEINYDTNTITVDESI